MRRVLGRHEHQHRAAKTYAMMELANRPEEGLAPMSDLLSNSDAARRLGMSLSGFYRLQRADEEFPKPIRLSGPRGKPQWAEDELDAFVARRRTAKSFTPASG
ncbi:MAG TPA: hypothetical protein DHW63_00825 [Hyphomonadaceae bacterium]|nr:hypothetical protein [Hyphomonadaceae bacterium]